MYGNGVGGIHYIHVEFSKADVAEFKALSPSDGFISGLAYIAMYLGSNDEMARYMSHRKDNYRSGESNLKILARGTASREDDIVGLQLRDHLFVDQ